MLGSLLCFATVNKMAQGKTTSDNVLFFHDMWFMYISIYHIGWKHHQNDEVFLGRGEL